MTYLQVEPNNIVLDSLSSKIPILFKISPDINILEVEELSKIFLESSIDGLILTNTSIYNKDMLNMLAETIYIRPFWLYKYRLTESNIIKNAPTKDKKNPKLCVTVFANSSLKEYPNLLVFIIKV